MACAGEGTGKREGDEEWVGARGFGGREVVGVARDREEGCRGEEGKREGRRRKSERDRGRAGAKSGEGRRGMKEKVYRRHRKGQLGMGRGIIK